MIATETAEKWVIKTKNEKAPKAATQTSIGT